AVYAAFPARGAVLRRLGERLDSEMLAISAAELAEMTPRERLFELLMRRFDAMAPYREALGRMSRPSGADVEAVAMSLCNLGRVACWLVNAVDGPRSGLAGLAARKAVLLVYARTFSVWLVDDTEDRARTLAELDRRLGQLESLAGWAGRFCRRGGGRRAGSAETAAA
ncbi:MAG TPA: hypothetical protein PKA09_25050, partial [Geminicoccus sp.]|nr:hypothetical protein [Geminicoccus sp.]